MTEYRVKVIGSGGVGKSALTIKFIQNTFVEKYDPTIEDNYRRQIDCDGLAVMLDITDTAGQEDYVQMRDEMLVDGQGFIIVYSITDPASFDEVSHLYEAILKAKDADGNVPCVLAGNKVDLANERAVLTEQGEEQARRMGPFTKFFETSAKAEPSINVKEIFEEIVRLINAREGNVEEVEEDMSKIGPDRGAPVATSSGEVERNTQKKKKKKKKKCRIL